jgi:hypothetical protein
MRLLTTVTAALVFLVVVSYGMATSWYHDDQCMIAQWKCAAGTLGVAGIVFVGPAAALATLVTATAWCVHAFQSSGRRIGRDS